MATRTENLWGELKLGEVLTPVAILRQAAAQLGTMTKNLVEASVETTVVGPQLRHTFVLVVPALSGYKYELFSIQHGVDPWPANVVRYRPPSSDIPVPPDEGLRNEAEFVAWLKDKLASEKTRNIINNLYAHVSR